MIQKNKRYQHFLWICRKIGRVPAEMAADVACLDPRDAIDMGKVQGVAGCHQEHPGRQAVHA